MAHDFKGPGGARKDRRWCQTRVYRAVWAEPSGGHGLMMRMEVKEDTSQTGDVPETPWKNRVMH